MEWRRSLSPGLDLALRDRLRETPAAARRASQGDIRAVVRKQKIDKRSAIRGESHRRKAESCFRTLLDFGRKATVILVMKNLFDTQTE